MVVVLGRLERTSSIEGGPEACIDEIGRFVTGVAMLYM